MGKTIAVRIEHYCPEQQRQDSETMLPDTHKIREFYLSKKDRDVKWQVYIPPRVDYLQLVTVECDTLSLGANEIFLDEKAQDTASIYPDAHVYDTDEALELSKHSNLFFGAADKKEIVEKFAAEKYECLVVTRSGNIRAFHKDRDVVLSHTEETNMWCNTTETSGVLSYGIG